MFELRLVLEVRVYCIVEPGDEAQETSESSPDTERSFALVQSSGYELTFHLTRPGPCFGLSELGHCGRTPHMKPLPTFAVGEIKHLPAQELCLFSPPPRPSVLMADEGL